MSEGPGRMGAEGGEGGGLSLQGVHGARACWSGGHLC